MKHTAFLALALAALTGPTVSSGFAASADAPVMVELFTSQGCSSCPPADAYMADLARRDDVVALSFHVDYWERLGWKDTFGSPENSERQRTYAAQRGDGRVYTPQVVVSGEAHAVGSAKAEVSALIEASLSPVDVDCSRTGDTLAITMTPAEVDGARVFLATFEIASRVPIDKGENGGRTVTYTHSVTELVQVGTWDGIAARLDVPMPTLGANEGAAVFVQTADGRVLGADYAKR